MYQFVKAVEGLSEGCLKLNTPVVSGNVSFYNETKNKGIFPTPTVGMVGLIKDIENRIPSHFQNENDSVVLVGKLTGEVGGSEYLKLRTGEVTGKCPEINLDDTAKIINFMTECAKDKLVVSANDVSEGGVAVTLCEMSFPNNIGVDVNLNSNGIREDFLLFGETQNILVLSVKNENLERLKLLATHIGLAVEEIGKTVKGNISIAVDKENVVCSDIGKLKTVFETSIESKLK
jgi:phosphoribosylformylglycinamidine synthase